MSFKPTETHISAPSKTGSKMAMERITGSATIKYILENGTEACPMAQVFTSAEISRIDMKECSRMD